MNIIPPNGYKAALYLRLSRDEEAKQESNSITNQRNILTEYANTNGYRIHDEYVDDGVSGTTFDRPGFMQMMDDIEAGKVNMVITKDLSRLGRDHIATGMYIEQVFPKHHIRYIAVNDGYDSFFDDSPASDILPFINIFNEFHAKQTSKKSRASRVSMAKQGKYLGAKAPFGYMKDPCDPYHLLQDVDAAETVRFIFQMACDGLGYKAICRRLREEDLPNPNAYALQKNPDAYKSDYWKAPHDWHATSVKTILTNPVYLGKVVSGRRRTRSFKDHEIIHVPEEDWIVVEGMHEPLIEQAVWDKAQKKLAVRKRCDNHGAIQIFAGLVKCMDCGYAMAYTQSEGKRRYQCSQYNVKGKKYCASHHITYDELYETVLLDIRRRAKAAARLDQAMLMDLKREAHGELDKRRRQAERESQKLEARMAELDTIIAKLFEENALGRLAQARYDTMLEQYENELKSLKVHHKIAKREVAEQQKRQSESEEFMKLIATYTDIKKLNGVILNELVNKIEVGAIKMVAGVKHRKIRIEYRQYCYAEVFTEGDLFAKWTEKDIDEMNKVLGAIYEQDISDAKDEYLWWQNQIAEGKFNADERQEAENIMRHLAELFPQILQDDAAAAVAVRVGA